MPLPDFIIGGERRSGTTSLAHWLEGHPEIWLRQEYDKAYFLETDVRGKQDNRRPDADSEAWERSHCPEEYASFFSAGAGVRAIGEKSSDYLFWQPAHARLARYLPDVHFIFVLRNPADRAWSHYWNEVGKGRERLTFEKALEAEDERCAASAWARNNLSYRTRGFYDRSVEHLLGYFPRRALRVVTLERMRQDPIGELRGILEFLDVDPDIRLDRTGARYNANWTMIPRPWSANPFAEPFIKAWNGVTGVAIKMVTRDKYRRRHLRMLAQGLYCQRARRETMQVATRAALTEIYAPHITRLEALLDQPFDEWRKD
jgi:hypothetical protein